MCLAASAYAVEARDLVNNLKGKDRLIVALDVPTAKEALGLVERLDNVSFFKIGWQLFMTGDLRWLLEQLQAKQVFVDLKVPGDIGNTIAAVIDLCTAMGVRFLTLSESVPPPTIQAARKARGDRRDPKLLTVPYLSSLDESDLPAVAGRSDLNKYILDRAKVAIDAGCDGLIASGDAIGLLRASFPPPTVIVSPGIRPAWAAANDHKRHTTPADAIRMGADYLVVGRPILTSSDPRDAAQRVISEIDSVVVGDAEQPGSAQNRPAKYGWLPAAVPAQ